jgi:alkylhydroperoxidase family enzyme
VLDYAVAMTVTPVQVPEELFRALQASLDAAELVELTATIAWENYRARFNHAFGIEAQGFSEGASCMPEPRASRAAPSS